jgi:hypothetical protein
MITRNMPDRASDTRRTADDTGPEGAIADAGRLYERYLAIAEIGRLPDETELDAWEAIWRNAEADEMPMGLVIGDPASI